MKRLKKFKYFFITFFYLSSCTTIEKKTDELSKKENEKMNKFLGKTLEEVKIIMGEPTSDLFDDDGGRLIFYRSKKYGISCVRRFEFDERDRVIGFISKGCF